MIYRKVKIYDLAEKYNSGFKMSDSEGSDSDGSYGGRKKMRRDEAEEVAECLRLFLFFCVIYFPPASR